LGNGDVGYAGHPVRGGRLRDPESIVRLEYLNAHQTLGLVREDFNDEIEKLDRANTDLSVCDATYDSMPKPAKDLLHSLLGCLQRLAGAPRCELHRVCRQCGERGGSERIRSQGALGAGMDDYLTKPLQAKELFAMMERVPQSAGPTSVELAEQPETPAEKT